MTDARTLILLLLLSTLPTTGSLAQSDADVQSFVITGVNVIPMDENRVLGDQTVIVRNGVIDVVGAAASTDVPAGILHIDGNGRYLMPGLADMHIHLRHDDELVNYVNWGVTTVMHLGGSGQTGQQLLDIRERIAEGDIAGPNIYTTGRILDGDPALPNNAYSLTTEDAARRAVQETAVAGFDFIKIYNNVAEPVFAAIVDEARKHNLAVIGHIPRGFDPLTSLGGGQSAIAHTEELFFTYFGGPRDETDMPRNYQPDLAKLPALIEVLCDNDVALMPDLSFSFTNLLMWDNLDILWNDPEFPYLHPATASLWQRSNINRRSAIENFILREQWKYALIQALTLKFQEAGLLQVIGTDSSLPGLFPGKAVHRELTELVKAGIANFDALAIGSRNAGEFVRRYLDDTARFGQVRTGYRADLVLLDENPLEDVRHARLVSGVAVGGRYLDRNQLDTRRAGFRTRYAALFAVNEQVDAALSGSTMRAPVLEIFTANAGNAEMLNAIESRMNSAGYAAAFADDLERARRILELNTELFPHSANTWDSLAEVVLYLGDHDKALALYRKALEVDPTFTSAADSIARILRDLGER